MELALYNQHYNEKSAIKEDYVCSDEINSPKNSSYIFSKENILYITDYKTSLTQEIKNSVFRVAGIRIEPQKSFFNLLDHTKRIVLSLSYRNKRTYYNSDISTIFVSHLSLLNRSKFILETLIYHEYGHVIDYQRKLKYKYEIVELMNRYRLKLMRLNDRSIWLKEYDFVLAKYIYKKRNVCISNFQYIELLLSQLEAKIWKMDDLTFEKRGIAKRDVIQQIVNVNDTIMSLNPKFGYGHTEEYFKNAGMKEAEFIAHAFENTFAGNSVFKKYLPDLYEEMIQFINKLS